MAGRMRVPRTRGVLSGLLLIILGAWGALIPFVGPYFHYAYTPDSSWTYTVDRLWLSVLPGAAAFVGGLIVLGSAHRAFASLGGWLAALGGAWFVVGLPLSALSGMPQAGQPTGGTTRQVLEMLGFFFGLGVVIVFLAALALGRFAVVGIKETQAAEEEAAAERLATMDDERYEPAAVASPTAAAAPADPVGESGYYPDRRTSTVDPDEAVPAAGGAVPTAGGAVPTAGGGPARRAAPVDGEQQAKPADPYNGWTASDADKQAQGRPAAGTAPAEPRYGESAAQPNADPTIRQSDWSAHAADGLPAAPPVDEPQSDEDGKLHRLLHRQDN